MKKRRKTSNKLSILVISFILMICILQVAPNYKKQIRNSNTNLILNNENITEKLYNELLINNGVIYISIDDIQKIFDSTIMIEESSNKIITVCNTKVTAIDINSSNIEINSVQKVMENSIIIQNQQYYLPISELENVYNIGVKYIENSNICMIDEKNKELIGAKLNKNANLKLMAQNFSLTIKKLKKDDVIIIMNEEDNGWLHIRTNSGEIGFIEKSKIEDKYYIRENMETTIGQAEEQITKISELKKIKTPKIEQIKTYDKRVEVIEKIVDEAILNNVKCLEVHYDRLEKEDEFAYDRFLLEIEANLKDVGIMLKKNS